MNYTVKSKVIKDDALIASVEYVFDEGSTILEVVVAYVETLNDFEATILNEAKRAYALVVTTAKKNEALINLSDSIKVNEQVDIIFTEDETNEFMFKKK